QLAFGRGLALDLADVDGLPCVGGLVDRSAFGGKLRPVAQEVKRRQHGFCTRRIGLDDEDIEFLHSLYSYRPCRSYSASSGARRSSVPAFRRRLDERGATRGPTLTAVATAKRRPAARRRRPQRACMRKSLPQAHDTKGLCEKSVP